MLSGDWRHAHLKKSRDVTMKLGMVVEEPVSGFVGAIVGWENGIVVLEGRNAKRRSFPLGPGFLLAGKPVILCIPPRQGSARPKYTASGSRVSRDEPAKVALPSRIYVEGKHDAQLVEKIWGDDLRHVGVAVEFLNGIDDLVSVVADFQPERGRRLGVLVDHLVMGTKEKRIAAEVARGGYGEYVQITGHRFIDIWQVIKPQVLGFDHWPSVPRDVDFKKGTLKALSLAWQTSADVGRAWQQMLAKVSTIKDLDIDFVREVEKLIDFVSQDHLDQF